jgi:hypothetical protein
VRGAIILSAMTKASDRPVLLSGGNPQIAKGYGNEPVQAWITAAPGWKSDTAQRIDDLVTRTVPDVQKAVKWNSPLYGMDGKTWFLSMHCFAKYIKVAFFRGVRLNPMPPEGSKTPSARYLHVHEGEALDEAQFAEWVKQASQIEGEKI